MDNSVNPNPSDDQIGYDPQRVEAKWQQTWQDRDTNTTDVAAAPDPYYALMMFPYPSAEGLHVGNLFAFVGNDIYGRFQRLQGHNVFEPFGYDAFGIHSENYALKVGKHPMNLIPQNIANFERQVQRGTWLHCCSWVRLAAAQRRSRTITCLSGQLSAFAMRFSRF